VLIGAFLEQQQTQRAASTRTRNLLSTAIRSFFRFIAFEGPAYSADIQRVLAIPGKRCDEKLIHFLNRPEIEALLQAPDRTTWLGRRDHALLSLAIQTGPGDIVRPTGCCTSYTPCEPPDCAEWSYRSV